MVHECCAFLESEGFLERGIFISDTDSTQTPFFIREIAETKGGNLKVGKRRVILNYCPTCGEQLEDSQ